MTGSLAPPPPYGSEQGSILLESGRRKDEAPGSPSRGHHYSQSFQTYITRGPTLESGHARTRSGNYRVLPPTSPGPQRSPTDISLAQLVPTDESGEGSASSLGPVPTGDHVVDITGLGLHEAMQPPPEYTSPEHSDEDNTGSGSESDNTPLIRTPARSRGASAVTFRPHNPPIPSYSDAVRQGAGRDRSRSDTSAMQRRSDH
jgi:hypothetical protein